MEYADKLAILTTIILAARIQRGNPVTSPQEVRAAVQIAKMICTEAASE